MATESILLVERQTALHDVYRVVDAAIIAACGKRAVIHGDGPPGHEMYRRVQPVRAAGCNVVGICHDDRSHPSAGVRYHGPPEGELRPLDLAVVLRSALHRWTSHCAY